MTDAQGQGGWFPLVDADAVRLDDSVYVECEGLRLLVHHLGDGYYVTSSQCPHEDFTMDRCPLVGSAIVCTEHGWKMDVRTGDVVDVGDEDAHLPTFPAEVREGKVWAKLF
jgi:nitrite reductase/ring-hydroxylating ferredoxin subunit